MGTVPEVRFIIFGAGAIGGVVGGRLVQAGHDVVLIARGAHATAILTVGLTLESPDESQTMRVPTASDASGIRFRPEDVVLLAVKSQHTLAALNSLRDHAPPATPIVCLQNGVENERAALRLFPNVYGVSVMCPTAHLSPGVVQAFSSPVTGILDVGRYPSGADGTAQAISRIFAQSTFSSQMRTDILRWKYAKLLTNLGNAVEAVCGPQARRGPIGGVLKDEGVACLRAADIAFASDEEDAARRGELLDMRPIGVKDRQGGSSWQSLTRQSGSIETDYLNGEIVLLGRLHGVPTPANALLQELANQMAADCSPPGMLSEEDFLERLADADS